ncbi:hypothetical protein AB0392_08425 [Nonomuraea angiospora]|uniref:hypothetical protein n=1 Tax=Nonomuraea angiospora TaxID=46172 RepID=UPI00344BFAB2
MSDPRFGSTWNSPPVFDCTTIRPRPSGVGVMPSPYSRSPVSGIRTAVSGSRPP